jgi:hypothetical protein
MEKLTAGDGRQLMAKVRTDLQSGELIKGEARLISTQTIRTWLGAFDHIFRVFLLTLHFC